jgi:hypothetical protein
LHLSRDCIVIDELFFFLRCRHYSLLFVPYSFQLFELKKKMAPKFRVGIMLVTLIVFSRNKKLTPPLPVVHSGGGVAGVTMAVALARYPNIEIDIYEAAAKFGEVGVGIGIWYRAWSILMKLGLHDLAQVVSSVPSEGQGWCFFCQVYDFST